MEIQNREKVDYPNIQALVIYIHVGYNWALSSAGFECPRSQEKSKTVTWSYFLKGEWILVTYESQM